MMEPQASPLLVRLSQTTQSDKRRNNLPFISHICVKSRLKLAGITIALRYRMKTRLTIALTLLLFTASLVPAQTTRPTWQPPAPRKSPTLFAPKPLSGNNIFKGEKEVWLSDALEELEGGVFSELKDQEISAYIAQVGTNLTLYSANPKKTYTFIVTTDDTPDAMTSGAGRIYVSLGMLRLVQTEDELAGIIAHEITHDVFAHIPKTLTRQMFWMTGTRKVSNPVEVRNKLEQLLGEYQKTPIASVGEQLVGFARFDELEADRGAFYITYKAGYNPQALSTILDRYEQEQKEDVDKSEYRWGQVYALLLGNHPLTAQRSLALSWESNFVKTPAKDSFYRSAAFDEMKKRLVLLDKTGK
jgi:Putative Zn-dependent protease, contains TPR repeats